MNSTESWKYFFLADGWIVGRVWSTDGPWSTIAWRRGPRIERTHLSITQQDEVLWLYRAESNIVTIEVKPEPTTTGDGNFNQPIGQVLLTRLISADQVIERLSLAQAHFQTQKAGQF
ncbi:hypothetical protein H6F46_09810 [Limnothrix sp. FACHB-1083]|uniref:hypothetical protein n=1 Tax=unclassified Limnothrix TaxID=2632864 RepID=UPI0016813753|nr:MULTISPECIES: hypothetical protein [unclassified Limnothrix]MBD2160988.1 hypothetical protein [Limnothrix sp. FACHB-1083]MBD2191689.1 hypothetical protein [Limnothrix sp. FACHB-1088]